VSASAPRETGSPADGARHWAPRLLALLFLTGAAVAVLVVVNGVHAKKSVSDAEANSAMTRLATANQALSSQLALLKAGASPKAAQTATRSAQTLTKTLSADLADRGILGVAVHAVFDAELSYLDAVGSALNNPHSLLLDKTVTLARPLRSALKSLPTGAPQAVSGAENLVAYSHTRGH
jgi:hypothetical protein